MKRRQHHPRKLKVWDKTRWHLDGEFPKDLSAEDASRHILFMLRWLQQKGLTTPDGDDEAEGSGTDVSINSEMVSDQGRAFLDKHYDRWLEQVDYRKNRHGPKLLETFWKEFQRDKPTNKVEQKATAQARLFDHLKRKARRNEVEVEDLLRIATKGTAEAALILRQLQKQYSWDKKLERWVANICLYLEKGPQALVGCILDERQPKVDREMAIVVLETVNTPDSAKALVRVCQALLKLNSNRKITFQIMLAIISFNRRPLPSSSDQAKVRLALHKFLASSKNDVEAATAYCALRVFGNSESIEMIRSRPPLKGAWEGVEAQTIREIQKRANRNS